MAVSGAWNLAPAMPNNETWKYLLQIPYTLIALGLTIAATVEIFAFMRRKTFREERILLLRLALLLAAIPVAATFFWSAQNWYQAVMIGRQYALIGLTGGFTGAWVWVTWLRPIRMESQIENHGDLWILWLACAAILATTTKGGIFWALFPREGGEMIWRLSSDALLFGQLWCCAGFALNLYQWRSNSADVAPVYLPDPQALAPSLLHRR
jgi:hypothetical protein